MRCLSLQLSALAAALLILPAVRGEEPTALQELKELRETVQQQSKQIELLAEQIGRLTRAIEGQKAPEGAAATTSIDKPAPAAAAEPVPEAPKAEAIPKAEPVSNGPKHTVAKGETLTSIAKQYNIPIAELKKANTIQDERKLQIGQILTVPPTKAPETPDKRENP